MPENDPQLLALAQAIDRLTPDEFKSQFVDKSANQTVYNTDPAEQAIEKVLASADKEGYMPDAGARDEAGIEVTEKEVADRAFAHLLTKPPGRLPSGITKLRCAADPAGGATRHVRVALYKKEVRIIGRITRVEFEPASAMGVSM